MGVFSKDNRYEKIGEEVSKFISEEQFYKQATILELKWYFHMRHVRIDGKHIDFKIRESESVMDMNNFQEALSEVTDDNWWGENRGNIKGLEAKYNHDIVAIQYYTMELLKKHNLDRTNIVHWGLTSQDIVNTVYTKNLRDSIKLLNEAHGEMKTSMLHFFDVTNLFSFPARTHGQKAVEYNNMDLYAQYDSRIDPSFCKILNIVPTVKFGNGAVGNYDHINKLTADGKGRNDYDHLCRITVQSFFGDFTNIKVQGNGTSQNNGYTYIVDVIYELHRYLHHMLDMVQDMWYYAMLGYIKKPTNLEEHGSSTMPQKSNPIEFENAEGNIKMAISMCEVYMKNLNVSRFQRDLSDITMIRNMNTLICHVLLSMRSATRGFTKFIWNKEFCESEYYLGWELDLESIQLIEKLHPNGWTYEEVKEKIYNLKTLKTYYDEREQRWENS